jgi:hypothetical protein
LKRCTIPCDWCLGILFKTRTCLFAVILFNIFR